LLAYRIVHFLFYSSADHRALHSFPTRRSSDLTDLERFIQGYHAGWAAAKHPGPGDIAISLPVYVAETTRRARDEPEARRLMAMRSEEHTSELQSRGHLVCRLLLEKKKQHT